MSATNRGAARQQLDDYPTPHWPVHRLLEKCDLPGGLWVEPCSGAGSIISAVNEVRSDVIWLANEINPIYEDDVKQVSRVVGVRIGSALDLAFDGSPAVIITNPPFNISEEILRHLNRVAPHAIVVILQRANWFECSRAELFRELKPSIYALPQRPSFRDVITFDPKTKKNRVSSTDATAYAWFVFDGLGRFVMLEDTPDEVRKAEKEERRRKNLDWQNRHVVEDCHIEIASATEDEKADEIEDESADEIEFNLTELFNKNEGESKMAWLPDGMAEEVAKSEAFVRGNRARDGEYVFMHLKSSYEKTQKGMAVIIEHEVVSAKATKEGVEPNAVGEKVTYFLPDYGDAKVMLKPNLKTYVCGLLGADVKKVPEKVVSETVTALGEGLARGMYIRGTTFHTPKKGDGEDFMGFNWAPVPGENTLDSPTVKARRELLEKQAGALSSSQQAASTPTPPAPGAAPAPPAPPTPNLLDGWTPNPNDPNWVYRFNNGNTEQKLKADVLAGR